MRLLTDFASKFWWSYPTVKHSPVLFLSCSFVCCLCVFMWVSADAHACSVCKCLNDQSGHCIFLNYFLPNLFRQDISLNLGPNPPILASFTPCVSTHQPLRAGANNPCQTSRHFAWMLGSEVGSSSVCHRHVADLAVTPPFPHIWHSVAHPPFLHSSPPFFVNVSFYFLIQLILIYPLFFRRCLVF